MAMLYQGLFIYLGPYLFLIFVLVLSYSCAGLVPKLINFLATKISGQTPPNFVIPVGGKKDQNQNKNLFQMHKLSLYPGD